MISISSAMKQTEIQELLEGYNGDFAYSFQSKKGIKMIYNVNGNVEEAASMAKKLIKKQPWGSVLYFQVEIV